MKMGNGNITLLYFSSTFLGELSQEALEPFVKKKKL